MGVLLVEVCFLMDRIRDSCRTIRASFSPPCLQGGNCTAGAAPRQLELPWGPPLFTDEERLRGMSYLGGGARMRAFACKLMGGGPVKVVFLGGSITAGRGAGDEAKLSYVPRFARYLNATFPARWGWRHSNGWECKGACRGD